jgi:GDP-L-fucose synthase
MFMLPNKRIWVAGHQGLVGSALVRALPDDMVMTIDRDELDLRDQMATRLWVKRHKPDAIILAAATVGGIGDNKARPADFLYDNLMIEANVIHAAYEAGVDKLLFLGSSCIYPREAAQPITEDALLTGVLEPTNEAYAIAKIAGIKLCQSYRQQFGAHFISAMPCNLYGPGDRFDAERSHVIPALMLKMHQSKLENRPLLELWGTGSPLREFLHVDDLAGGLLLMMVEYDDAAPLNIGSGHEISIHDLAHMVAQVVGYQGQITFNAAHPDGTPRKVLDSKGIRALGWQPRIDLMTGLQETYDWFCRNEQFITRAA